MTSRLSLLVLLAATLLAGCEHTLDPDALDVTGQWGVNLGVAPSEFEFSLTEDAGVVEGTWSMPSQFSNYPVWGRRDGEVVTLSAYSPNAYPVSLDLRFVRRNVMEGTFYFAVTAYDATLMRK